MTKRPDFIQAQILTRHAAIEAGAEPPLKDEQPDSCPAAWVWASALRTIWASLAVVLWGTCQLMLQHIHASSHTGFAGLRQKQADALASCRSQRSSLMGVESSRGVRLPPVAWPDSRPQFPPTAIWLRIFAASPQRRCRP